MKNMILFGLLILLFGCTSPSTQINNTNTSTNTSTNPIVKLGDTVSVDYTLEVDGKILDTSVESVAKSAGIYDSQRKYAPLNVQEKFGSGFIQGFVANILGMKVNETKLFSVSPENGYGLPNKDKFLSIPRYYNKSLVEEVPRTFLESKGINVTAKGSYKTNFGIVNIQNYSDTNVTLFYFLQPGDVGTVSGVPQKVISVSNLTALIEFNLDVNKSYDLPDPVSGQLGYFKVIDKSSENITLDGNHPLAGKTLNFNVTLLKITPQN